MKTNKDLFENILVCILLILMIVGFIIFLDKWKGVFYGILIYFLIIIFGGIFVNYNKYIIWCKKELKLHKFLGITFKWFSNGR